MIYDTVVCVHPADRNTAKKAVRSIRYFLDSRKIYLITTPEVFSEIEASLDESIPLRFLDENTLIKNIDLEKVMEILTERIGPENPANWYLQQFLKMGASLHPDIADHYLIWDGDTILLRPIRFFDDDGHILFNPQTESHKPYFDFIEDVLDMKKQVDHSFVNEHLMVRKSYMQELIRTFQQKAPEDKSWVWFILNSIRKDNLTNSGFSEFETYGNFVAYHYKNRYKKRPFRSSRGGTATFGLNPNRYDLFRMMDYGTVIGTFEKGQEQPYFNIKAQKVKSYLLYYWSVVIGDQKKEMRRAASVICG